MSYVLSKPNSKVDESHEKSVTWDSSKSTDTTSSSFDTDINYIISSVNLPKCLYLEVKGTNTTDSALKPVKFSFKTEKSVRFNTENNETYNIPVEVMKRKVKFCVNVKVCLIQSRKELDRFKKNLWLTKDEMSIAEKTAYRELKAEMEGLVPQENFKNA